MAARVSTEAALAALGEAAPDVNIEPELRRAVEERGDRPLSQCLRRHFDGGPPESAIDPS